MVGNLKPDFQKLDHQFKSDFMRNYCSLCAAIRSRYNLVSTLTLNYDITFILLSLQNYLDDAVNSQTRCPARYFALKQNKIEHSIFNKAADISMLLISLKLLDYRCDDEGFLLGNPLLNITEYVLSDKRERIINSLSPKTQLIIREYIELIKTPNTNFEKTKTLSGDLAEQICYELGLTTSIPLYELEKLCKIFKLLGMTLSCLDPMLDLSTDLRKHKFNIIDYNAFLNKTSYDIEFKEIGEQYIELHNSLLKLLENNDSKKSRPYVNMLKVILIDNLNKLSNQTKLLFNDNPFVQEEKFNSHTCSTQKIAGFGLLGLLPLFSCDGGCCSCASGIGQGVVGSGGC